MNKENELIAYVISDFIGQPAVNIVRTALSKFTNLYFRIKDYTFITESYEIDKIVKELSYETKDTIIFYTFSNEDLGHYLKNKTVGICNNHHDILKPIIKQINETTGLSTNNRHKPNSKLDKQYFDRISALEFAVTHDDGKEPSGFLEADILILGVSRTSKTPLSIYLANNNYKVANLPLLPEVGLPDELWKVDSKKIIGLTNGIDILSKIRKKRMDSYGMKIDTIYSDRERIKEEINYSNNLYEKLNCKVINVANKSIEETAGMIIGHLNEDENFNFFN